MSVISVSKKQHFVRLHRVLRKRVGRVSKNAWISPTSLKGLYRTAILGLAVARVIWCSDNWHGNVIDPKNPQLGSPPVLNQTNGNPKLGPENAYTYYIGGVWSPGSTDP